MERNDIKEDLEYVRNYFAQVRAAGKPKEHLQRCIRTLKYPEVLRDAGFVSYNGEDLSWYKVLNHEVLQTVYLYSDCGRFPLTLEIGYGIHPLFIPAPVPQKVVTQGLWWNEVHTSIMLPTPQAPLAVNACVSCPTEGRHGIERLEEIAFSKFNQTQLPGPYWPNPGRKSPPCFAPALRKSPPAPPDPLCVTPGQNRQRAQLCGSRCEAETPK